MTKLLIVGLGSIGRRHLRNLTALGQRDVVLLRSHRSTLPDDELSGFPVETDLHAALRKHSPGAVIIANPSALHMEVALAAAETGCSILIEKPISHTLDHVDRLQETVRRTGSQILVGFQFRFHPHLLRAAHLLSEGTFGRVFTAHVHFGEYLPSWHPWEDYRHGYAARADLGGGVLLTQCHSLDYIQWLLGSAEAAWGMLARRSDLEVTIEDTAEIGLRFPGGVLASVHLDYAERPPSHRLEVSGAGGLIQVDLLGGLMRIYQAETDAWEEARLPADWERNTMFVEEMRNFLDMVEGRARPAASLEDGIRVMHLIAAVQESHRTGTLVSLPL